MKNFILILFLLSSNFFIIAQENLDNDFLNASVISDLSNKYFEVEINSNFSNDETWILISQIISNYFDEIEYSDFKTGYLKTNWKPKYFKNRTVRSKAIIKLASINPLKYKIKIISEISIRPNANLRDDEAFREWDRILKNYEELLQEFRSRLGKK
ncbi:MAG: hypothetical protein KA792_04295 [Bacteroidales bacterium]|nr:hypothetical protein [Bacteroidales bacterium]